MGKWDGWIDEYIFMKVNNEWIFFFLERGLQCWSERAIIWLWGSHRDSWTALNQTFKCWKVWSRKVCKNPSLGWKCSAVFLKSIPLGLFIIVVWGCFVFFFPPLCRRALLFSSSLFALFDFSEKNWKRSTGAHGTSSVAASLWLPLINGSRQEDDLKHRVRGNILYSPRAWLVWSAGTQLVRAFMGHNRSSDFIPELVENFASCTRVK